MRGASSETAGHWALLGRALWRRVKTRSRLPTLHRWSLAGRSPDRIVATPPDLRRGDAQVALDIYHGRFPLAGHLVETGGRSPFGLAAHEAWRRALHRFRWLRHFRAAGTELAAASARAQVRDWLAGPGRRLDGIAWEPAVAAARLISWLQNSPMLLRAADGGFRRQFFRTLGLHVRFLRAAAPELPPGAERLKARIAVCLAATSLPFPPSVRARIAHRLSSELETQILPDGGHVSRNPAVLVELLLDLLPLRQSFADAGLAHPPALLAAIERMMPALRFFRHCDGSIARFNGAGAVTAERVAAILRHDDAQGAPLFHAPHSGYARLALGPTVVIADVGPVPPADLALEAHAGCLSFEMSSGQRSIVVNSGVDRRGAGDFRPLARATAAHSTLTLNDTSQGRFVHGGAKWAHLIGHPLVGGPRRVLFERLGDERSQGFHAGHDGYASRYGVLHERALRLSEEGLLLEGFDRLVGAGGALPDVPAALRFHLHPEVELFRDGDGALVLAVARGGQWRFSSPDLAPRVEESIFFASAGGPRRSRQIVLSFSVAAQPAVRWSFRRLSPEMPPTA